MKHFLTLVTYLLFSYAISAQIHERSYGFGFDTDASAIKPISNNRWVVLGHTAPALDWFFKDSLFLMVLHHDGSIEMKITLDLLYGEVNRAEDLLPLPDGGFAVLTTTSDCDVYGSPNMLQKISPDGKQVWKISPNGIFSTLVESIHLSSDGHIMGRLYNQVIKISAATGETLEATPIAIGNQSLSRICFIPGKEDFIATGVPDFQYWKKVPVAGGFQYEMSKSADFPNTYHSLLTPAPQGWFYAISDLTGVTANNLVRINTGLDYEILTPVGSVQQLQAGSNGLYILEYDYSKEKSSLRKTDWLGQALGKLTISDSRLKALSVAVRDDSIALAGSEYYGVSNQFGFWDASYCWVRTFEGMAPVASGHLYNAAITAVEQRSNIDTISHSGGGPTGQNKIYSLQGGNFRLQITNKGDTTLERVLANIRFGRDYSIGICFVFPTRQQLYEGLNLMPGESVWVEFGDVWAANQSPLPTQAQQLLSMDPVYIN